MGIYSFIRLIVIVVAAYCHYCEAIKNIALRKTAKQSSTLGYREADLAVDGSLSQMSYKCAHTGFGTSNISNTVAWWQVDLGEKWNITSIKIYHREETIERLNGYWLYVGTSKYWNWEDPCYEHTSLLPPQTKFTAECTGRARYITIVNYNFTQEDGPYGPILELCEVQIFGLALKTSRSVTNGIAFLHIFFVMLFGVLGCVVCVALVKAAHQRRRSNSGNSTGACLADFVNRMQNMEMSDPSRSNINQRQIEQYRQISRQQMQTNEPFRSNSNRGQIEQYRQRSMQQMQTNQPPRSNSNRGQIEQYRQRSMQQMQTNQPPRSNRRQKRNIVSHSPGEIQNNENASAEDEYKTASDEVRYETASAEDKYATASAADKYATASAEDKYATARKEERKRKSSPKIYDEDEAN